MRGVARAGSRLCSVWGPYGDEYEYFLVDSRLDLTFTLKMEAIFSSEASSVNFSRTTRRHILQYSALCAQLYVRVSNADIGSA
jgi:hypothetical protein